MSNTGKQKKKANNKTTSGTGKNTAMLGLNNTEPSNEVNTKANTTKKAAQKPNEGKLIELETKTKELQDQLDKINFDIETERNLLTEEAYQYNIEITDKNFEINNLSSENKFLIGQLKEIKENLDNKMKIGKIFLVKMEQLKKTEAKLKKDIEIKEKEILLAQKNAQIVEADYNRMKSIQDKNDGERESILKTELESLENEKAELESDNMNLRKKIKEHKYCQKSKTNLNSTLNVLTNAYQFEVKKTNMLNSESENLKEKKERIKQEKKEEKEERINQSNRSISYCTKIREKVLKKMEKKNSEKNIISKRAALRIANICNTIGDQYKKKSGDIKNINNSDYKLKQKTLFTETEQSQLANIIPPSILNEFQLRFEALENQRYDLVDKLKNTQDKHAVMLSDRKIKLNYTELKKKEQQLLFVDLNSHLTKKNVNISKLKSDINRIMKEYNTWDKLLKMKCNENKRLNKYIDVIKNNKNNKKKTAEEAQTGGINLRKEKVKVKNGGIFETQNSIRLAYEKSQ